MLKLFLELLHSKKQATRGFSLIELSVVIAVSASATVGFLAWTQPENITNAQKAIETRKKIAVIEKAIQAFVVERGRLPCPADPHMRIDNTRSGGTDFYANDFGNEDLDTNDLAVNGLTTLGVDCHDKKGAVPVYSIGLGKEYINDGWQRRFTYQVSTALCGADGGVSGSPTAAEIATSRTTGCTRIDYANNTGDITVKDSGGSNITTEAAYVIVSHGSNGHGAFVPAGVQVNSGQGGSNEDENENDTDNEFVKASISSSFDDITYFKTKDQIDRLNNKAEVYQIDVSECSANSTTISNIDIDTTIDMSQHINSYERGDNYNSGEQVGLGLLMAFQTICVEYYGHASGTVQNVNWVGAQCPGGGTYDNINNSCSCADSSWDGDCS